jgi:MYXO-CTERM domain-containing protein
MRRTPALLLSAATAATLGAALLAGPASGTASPSAAGAVRVSEADPDDGLRDVMWVGNNWSGNASIIDASSMRMLRTGINLIPDKSQELADIQQSPDRLAFFLAIQQGPGEGHNQYVDDMFTTRDGKHLAVSRPSFGDVVWIDIAKATAGRRDSVVREQQMDGYRTDHMNVSPDGRRLLVSDSTERQVIEYSMVNETVNGKRIRMGDRLRTFPTGETPHESNYTDDASKVFHASIGKVYTPGDDAHSGPVKLTPAQDAIKGDRWFQVVRNRDFKILQRWDMGKELAESGFPDMSSAVRPMAISPDERFFYFQVSYFHGFVVFDSQAPDKNGQVDYETEGVPEPRRGAVRRVVNLPNRVPDMPLTQYVNDSAHHGLSMNEAGTKLCVAGTMDDYAAIVDRRTLKYRVYDKKSTGHYYGKPYWTTEGLHNRCWISLSEADAVAVLDFRTGRELAFLKVGDHPQRIRHGYVSERLVRSWGGKAKFTEKPGEQDPAAALLEAESEVGSIPQDASKTEVDPEALAEAGAALERTRAARQAKASSQDVSLVSEVAQDPRTPWVAVVFLLGLGLLVARRRRTT